MIEVESEAVVEDRYTVEVEPVAGSRSTEAEYMAAVETDLDTLDAAGHSAAEADMGLAVGHGVADVVELAEGTDSIVEMVAGYFSIAAACPMVIVEVAVIAMVVASPVVGADMEARDTLASVVAPLADTVEADK